MQAIRTAAVGKTPTDFFAPLLNNPHTLRRQARTSDQRRQSERQIMATRYGKKASTKVERAMKEKNAGTRKSGRSGKTVTSRKQAIAIGLSEARKEGAKVPPAPGKKAAKKATKKSATKKVASKKTASKKTATKKTAARKKAPAKKSR
jgi:hypothetical protein